MTPEPDSGSPGLDRRGFLSRLAGSGLAAGVVVPNLDLLGGFPS